MNGVSLSKIHIMIFGRWLLQLSRAASEQAGLLMSTNAHGTFRLGWWPVSHIEKLSSKLGGNIATKIDSEK
jgi:hypothetical protein